MLTFLFLEVVNIFIFSFFSEKNIEQIYSQIKYYCYQLYGHWMDKSLFQIFRWNFGFRNFILLDSLNEAMKVTHNIWTNLK